MILKYLIKSITILLFKPIDEYIFLIIFSKYSSEILLSAIFEISISFIFSRTREDFAIWYILFLSNLLKLGFNAFKYLTSLIISTLVIISLSTLTIILFSKEKTWVTQVKQNNKIVIDFIKYFNIIDIEEVENKLSNEALWNQLIYRNYYTKIKIDEKKIRDEIKSINNEIYSYLLYEILFNSDDKSETEKLYNQIKLSIEKNGFENTASIFSISESAKTGGKLGWIEEGSMSKKIVSEISQLKNDEYTKPILIPGGFLILSVKNKKKIQKNLDIEQEVKLKIKSIQNQQLNQFSNIYFNKIKKNVSINES